MSGWTGRDGGLGRKDEQTYENVLAVETTTVWSPYCRTTTVPRNEPAV